MRNRAPRFGNCGMGYDARPARQMRRAPNNGVIMPNPVGRPTMYNEEMQAKAEQYMYGWADLGDAIPSRVGMCCYLGISKQTSYDWEDAHPQFLDTCKAIEALQEREAVNKGITGVFNSQITKLVLANHGYSDRQAVDHTTGGEAMQSVVVLPSKQ